MSKPPTSTGAAGAAGGTGTFGVLERKRQAAFRRGLATPTDAIGLRHDYLLALGCEKENLYPTLRGENGALRFFAERNVKWWQGVRIGDAPDGFPTTVIHNSHEPEYKQLSASDLPSPVLI